MQRRQLYFLLSIAALSIVVVAITLGVVLGTAKDDESSSGSLLSASSSTLASAENVTDDDSSFITPDAILESVTDSPSVARPSFQPSSEPTILPTMDDMNLTETIEPSNSSWTDSPSPSEINATFWPSALPTDENATFWPSFSPTKIAPPDDALFEPSVSPIPANSNDDLTTQPPPPVTASSSFPLTSLPLTTNTASPTPPPTVSPMASPTEAPTLAPIKETSSPSLAPSASPSVGGVPGRLATLMPSQKASDPADDTNLGAGTRFYAIGDVPYTKAEAKQLKVQIENLAKDAEFLIHVGDIRSARDGRSCEIEEYYEVAAILNQSHAPVFLVLGDNEWNDCPNIDQGFDHWMKVFGRFDEQWDHSFSVVRHEPRTENFYFVHKRTLFFGLNLVGGLLHRGAEWEARLQDLYLWVRQTVDSRLISNKEADSVVIFGHADPNNNHEDFFQPLQAYLGAVTVATIPFLYLNGDAHAWNYKTNFYDRSNFLRMQVEGGTREPPLQVSLDHGKTTARSKPPSEVFTYDRMLSEIQV